MKNLNIFCHFCNFFFLFCGKKKSGDFQEHLLRKKQNKKLQGSHKTHVFKKRGEEEIAYGCMN